MAEKRKYNRTKEFRSDTNRNQYAIYDDYAEIQITSPKYGIFKVMIDLDKFEELKKVHWGISKACNKDTNTEVFFYVSSNRWRYANGRVAPGLLHRIVTNAPKGMVVDHINKDTMDNRLINLRVCSQSENRRNTKEICANNTSGHKGVTWSKKDKAWMSYVYMNNSFINLGYSKTIEEAVAKRKAGEEKYYGEYAPAN